MFVVLAAVRIFFRLLAAIPPLIGAAFVSQLDTITSFTGTVGIIITFVFPSLLQLSSRRMLKDLLQIDTARVRYTWVAGARASITTSACTSLWLDLYVSMI